MNNNFFPNPNTDGSSVMFNQALYQMIRLHELIQRTEFCNMNPLGFNFELQKYNYEILFNDYCSIFLEIVSKLDPEEREKLKNLRKKIIEAMKNKPPFITKAIPSAYSNRKFYKEISESNWNVLNELLFDFRINLENSMDKHGFGNPNVKDSRKSILE